MLYTWNNVIYQLYLNKKQKQKTGGGSFEALLSFPCIQC